MRRLTIVLAMFALLTVWLAWGNNALEVNTFVIGDEKLPSAFDGFRIAQVSDLHNSALWENVVGKLEEISPDLIVLTGDLIDSSDTDVAAALAFAEAAAEIAPCCYVSGNHEAWSPGHWDELRNGLAQSGVAVLEDETIVLEREGESVAVLGLRDPAFGSEFLGGQNDVAVFVDLAKNIKFENKTIYDQLLTEGLQGYWREYCDGTVTEDEAMANYYKYINEKYPEIVTP